MESWSSFASEGRTFFFSDEPYWPNAAAKASAPAIADESSSTVGGGLSEILGGGNNGGLVSLSPNSSESASRASNASRESSLIALKLGGSAPKRARTRGGCCGGAAKTAAFCQVLGCNMDLSGSKEYHKKHKVCDVHSKTAVVIVNGVEQRFCQQCSRFHLLSEFDDGKRSCRRRLAGHNERRRKPQFDGLSDKTHKLSHSYNQGPRCLGNSSQKRTPFVFSGILPGEKHEQVDHFGHIKFEGESIFGVHPLAASFTGPQFSSKSFNVHPHGVEKHQRAFEIPPAETEDYFFHSAPTAIHKSSLGASNSPCALSLLSAQSQTFSSPLMLQNTHQLVPQLSDRLSRARPMERHEVNGFYSCGVHPVGMDQLEPTVVFPVAHNSADFEVVSDRAFEGSNYLHTKYGVTTEDGSTVDLLQLSSHLQRVEHERNFMPMKQENEDFCCFQTA